MTRLRTIVAILSTMQSTPQRTGYPTRPAPRLPRHYTITSAGLLRTLEIEQSSAQRNAFRCDDVDLSSNYRRIME